MVNGVGKYTAGNRQEELVYKYLESCVKRINGLSFKKECYGLGI